MADSARVPVDREIAELMVVHPRSLSGALMIVDGRRGVEPGHGLARAYAAVVANASDDPTTIPMFVR